MNVEICKWYNNADSPVLFFIDDLASVWVDVNGDDEVQPEEDWGYLKDKDGSAFQYLENEILAHYPNVKVTFFVPVGQRVGMVKNPKIKSVSKMINADEESKCFFKKVHNLEKFEIAYHGTTHGEIGDFSEDFKQEWETYSSLEEAIHTIEQGKEIYRDTIGEFPKGGKYCGYTSNSFSDESIDKTGFTWWCRYWNRGIEYKKIPNITGDDENPITNFDIKLFGKYQIVDIPSTIDGDLLNSIFDCRLKSIKGILKIMLRPILIKRKLKQLDYLLKNRLVVSIQEHIAPSRDDGRRQQPNIFDDKKSLNALFSYLINKNVWYCTGTELARYVRVREGVEVKYINDKEFILNDKTNQNAGEIITLYINDSKAKNIRLPNSTVENIERNIVNVPLVSGVYNII
jgi:hypothetical protein